MEMMHQFKILRCSEVVQLSTGKKSILTEHTLAELSGEGKAGRVQVQGEGLNVGSIQASPFPGSYSLCPPANPMKLSLRQDFVAISVMVVHSFNKSSTCTELQHEQAATTSTDRQVYRSC